MISTLARAQILIMLLEYPATFYDSGTGQLDDEQLEAAHQAATDALCRRANIGSKDDPAWTPTQVYDRLEEIRRMLRRTMDARARHQQELDEAIARLDDTQPHQASIYPQGGDQDGRKVPLLPPPDKPQPPRGTAVDDPQVLHDHPRIKDFAF